MDDPYEKQVKTMPANMIPERRKFRMDAALLWSVIQSQAGTAEKALLEAIMNAVDAKAQNCNITINETGYKVVDDGEGFKSRHEIESFFETFGTPHTKGDATYGAYRMGRGQLFAFSSTQWESGQFTMVVDIKKLGLEYDLHSNEIQTSGCSITGTWYEPIDSAEVIRIGFELKQLAQWMQIPVLLNGRRLNKDPENEAWTSVSEDAYFKIKTSGGFKPGGKWLVWEKEVFARAPLIPGEGLKNWATKTHWLDPNEHPIQLKVIGVDVAGENPFYSPVVEGELLLDGFAMAHRVMVLLHEMQEESCRLSGQAMKRIPLKNIFAELSPLLLTLHGLGYSMEELHRLVVGSLRISITQDELAAAMFE